MDEALILKVLQEPPWSIAKLDEASRGKVNGSCADTPEIEFAYWLNLVRVTARAHGQTVEAAENEVIEQARNGEFDK
ncbi:MAG: hypothetical protein WCG44_01355 [bacterium]